MCVCESEGMWLQEREYECKKENVCESENVSVCEREK